MILNLEMAEELKRMVKFFGKSTKQKAILENERQVIEKEDAEKEAMALEKKNLKDEGAVPN